MKNILYNGIVIDASSELVPCIRIAPFVKLGEGINAKGEQLSLQQILSTQSDVCVLPKGRTAISEALRQYDLQKDDVVTILTTSGNMYISSCVTNEIEKLCKWSREITPNTRVLFVNHEFGYPYDDWNAIKGCGFPIIEDCAHSLFSEDGRKGGMGDYVIYSLPKAFPLQLGGVLVANKPLKYKVAENKEIVSYIQTHLSISRKDIETIKEKRIENYLYLLRQLKELGIEPYFQLKEGVVPGVLLFRWKREIDYPDLKVFLQSNGVESSVFYGKNAFFIPIHQNLKKVELDYMITLLKYYYETKVK